jgi:hypothetical protein
MFGLSIFNGWNSYTGKNANLDRVTLGPQIRHSEGNEIRNELALTVIVFQRYCNY